MNRALLHLWWSLLERRTLRFGLGLRRPTTLIGFAAGLCLVGFLFRYRGHEMFGQLVRRESLVGGALVMLGGSLFKGLLKLKSNVFEISLATTPRVVEKRLPVRQDNRVAHVEGAPLCSVRLPKLALFRGVGAIFWKNLVVARRSKRELILACVFTMIYTALLAAIRWGLRDAMSKGGELLAGELAGFDNGVMLFLASLAFLLQWAFPFDFRRDGAHLVGFRTLPVSSFALVQAEIAVPTTLCLAFQALGIGLLRIYGRFDWPVLALMLFGYHATLDRPMPTLALTAPNTDPVSTPLREKLLNVFVSPGEVFEEVVASPPKPACWLAPTLFVCLTAIISLLVAPVSENRVAQVRQLAEAGAIVSSDTGILSSRLLPAAALTVATSAVAGTFWSALVLWFIGRMFLKTRFPFWKAAVVVGLTGMILALGTLVTGLLIAATGEASARPALSIFVGQSNSGNKVYCGLEAINFFHLWAATVLAVGLSKLARVSFKEAAFWVNGYWVALRVALILPR